MVVVLLFVSSSLHFAAAAFYSWMLAIWLRISFAFYYHLSALIVSLSLFALKTLCFQGHIFVYI